MEDKNMPSQPTPTSRKSPSVFPIILSTFLTTLIIIGGAGYWWYRTNNRSSNSSFKQIQDLQNQINVLKKNSNQLPPPIATVSPILTTLSPQPLATLRPIQTPSPRSDNTCMDLPVVAYSRAGLLNDADGLIEKAKLEQKFINPYIDYQKEKDMGLVSLHITVPQNIGEQYDVVAIFKEGAIESFLFGKFKQDFDWWKPDCMGGCTFSDAYRTKYPQVVE